MTLRSNRMVLLGLLSLMSAAESVTAAEAIWVREGREPALSGDGHWVAYSCNNRNSLCVTNTSTLVTEILVTTAETNDILQHVDIDWDGDTLAYWLRPGSNGSEELHVFHRDTAADELVSVNPLGEPGSQCCLNVPSIHSEPRLSGNGRYVVFSSYAEDLVPGDTNDKADIFVRNVLAATTVRISVPNGGGEGDGHSGEWGQPPDISFNGSVVAFMSGAENLVSNDINDEHIREDIFLADTSTGVIQRISETPGGTGGEWNSRNVLLNADGDVSAFVTDSENLHAGPYPSDIFLRYENGALSLINTPASGDGSGFTFLDNYRSGISQNGAFIVFTEHSDQNLVSPTPSPPGVDTYVWFDGSLSVLIPDFSGEPLRIYNADIDYSYSLVAAQATVPVDGVQTLSVFLVTPDDLRPPVILAYSLIPDGAAIQGAIVELEALASDLNRGGSQITGAEYQLDAGLWQPMSPYDGAFDTEVEQIQAFIDTSPLALGTHTVCVRATDQQGFTSEAQCQDFDVETDDPDAPFLVRCHLEPAWPQPGETVTIEVAIKRLPLTDTGSPVDVDVAEIWVNDKTMPVSINDGDPVYYHRWTSEVLTDDQFTYGCRARRGDDSVFTGWRTVAIGTPEGEGAIPLMYTGKKSHRIDIVIVADGDTYGSPDDELFQQHMTNLLRYLFEHRLYARYQHLFNIWLSRTTGSADSFSNGDIFEGTIVLPTDWEENYAFAEAAAILHEDDFRDFAKNGAFTTRWGAAKIFRHEAGHRPFGMADEYCCDGGYFENEPFPNVYKTLQACEDDAPDLGRTADSCRSWVSSRNGETYYTSEPASDDLMLNNSIANEADIRRFEWLFGRCLQGDC